MDIVFTGEYLWEYITGTLWPILQFLLGLTVVVFVHELGHFLAARFVGIKVDRFAIGMGPKLIGYKPGETEYCICALPLGGYVKMLGQEDFATREEGDDAQDEDAESENEEQETQEDDNTEKKAEKKTSIEIDPRSYNAKTPGQRFLVIVMGVVMNIIFAGLVFAGLVMYGSVEASPVIGHISQSYPSKTAEIKWVGQTPPGKAEETSFLKPNDVITSMQGDGLINTLFGDEVRNFGHIQQKAMLSDDGDQFTATLDRVVDGKTYTGSIVLTTQKQPGDRAPMLGIGQTMSNKIGGIMGISSFKLNDVITRINDQEIRNFNDIERIQKGLEGTKKSTVTILRDGKEETVELFPTYVHNAKAFLLKDGKVLYGEKLKVKEFKGVKLQEPTDQAEQSTEDQELLFLTEGGEVLIKKSGDFVDMHTDYWGMVPRMRIGQIMQESLFNRCPAKQAGLKDGDIILQIAETKSPSHKDIVNITDKYAGQEIDIVVLRIVDGKETTLTLQADIKKTGDKGTLGVYSDIDGAHSIVANVRENSLAAKIGITPNSQILKVNDQAVTSWRDVCNAVNVSDKEVSFTWQTEDGTEQSKSIAISSDQKRTKKLTLFKSSMFTAATITVQHSNPITALGCGTRKAADMALNSYASLRSLIVGNVSHEEMRGPLGIGQIAVRAANESLATLINLLAFLSAALAVFNFLPLPVLDGGHAVLIIIEKVRGKPLPLKVVNHIQMIGLIFLLTVFVLVTMQDCVRLF